MQYYRVIIKQLIEQILSLPSVYKKIAKITPNGFTGGFNIKLIYNVLGLLNTTKVSIITCGSGQLDNYINKFAIKEGLATKMQERKSYINNTDEIEDCMADIKSLISDFVMRTLKGS